MIFKKIESTEPVIDQLTNCISEALEAHKRVTWLIPGGSSIAIAAAVSQRLEGLDLKNLTATLTDERFGPVGHPDSNWLQLAQAGFKLLDAKLIPVLTDDDQAITVQKYSQTLEHVLDESDYRLGFFGMGADGHTAGNLPNSPAVSSHELAAGYDAGQFIRLTMTPLAIARLDEVVVYAVGDEKRTALENLQKDLPIMEQPAQVLKSVPAFTIYNDQIGEPS